MSDTPAGRAVVSAGSTQGRGRRSTRAMLAAAADAQASAEELARTVRSARAEVIQAFEAAREPQMRAAIKKRSVEAAKDIVDGRGRLDEPSRRGKVRIVDVLRAGLDRLVRVPGIGGGTAHKPVRAAEQPRQAAWDFEQFRIEFAPRNAAITRLLQVLAVWGAVRHAGAAHEAQAEQLASELAVQRPIAGPSGAGWLRRLFTRPRDRATADRAARRVRALLRTAESNGLLRAVADVRTVRTPSADEVWRDFERRSTAYYGLLGELVTLDGHVAGTARTLHARGITDHGFVVVLIDHERYEALIERCLTKQELRRDCPGFDREAAERTRVAALPDRRECKIQ